MSQSQTSVKDVINKRNLYLFTGLSLLLLFSAIFIHGPNVLLMALVAYIPAVGLEFLFSKYRKKPLDIGWMVTPLIVTLMIPMVEPFWHSLYIVGIASTFGVLFGKLIFGGTGKNIFNPAVVGILFVLISFPVQMNSIWVGQPVGDYGFSLNDLFFKGILGGVGETFRLGILILGVVMLVLKVADWRIPLTYISTVFIVSGLGFLIAPDTFKDPIISIFFGSLLFGAFFLATDPATAPTYKLGKVIYGIGLGLFTVLIRHYAAFFEGVIFSIIIMNALAPLIDSLIEEKLTKKLEVSS